MSISTMPPDDFAELERLHRCFTADRFTLHDIHRTAFRATSAYAKPDEDADYRALLGRLEGFVGPCPGPRGGEGWALTDRGLRYCERQLERDAITLEPARIAGPQSGESDAPLH